MNQSRYSLLRNCFLILAATLYASIAGGQNNNPLPEEAGQLFNGVASCAASTCHGAVRPFADSNILHNEFITWTREDRHAKAYQTLLSAESKRIANKMGIRAPHTEDICLDCHASNVPQKLRGQKFQLADGIGCESCHGGSGKWLTSHTTESATHAENIANGLYPSDDPVARAELCLSCHYGNNKKFVTHRIMGAGHPRLSFELDTFTQLMPPHFTVDADYRKRKNDADTVTIWALGQLAAAKATVEQLQGPRVKNDELFPELSLFDCHSCHHNMSNLRWKPRSGTGLGPGVVRISDAHLVMARNALTPVSAKQAFELQKLTVELHKASNGSAQEMKAAAAKIQALLPSLIDSVRRHNYSTQDAFVIIRNLVDEGLRGEFFDYAAAEQSTMALADLLSYLDAKQALKANQQKNAQKSLDQLYACVNNDERYESSCFIDELSKFKSLLGI